MRRGVVLVVRSLTFASLRRCASRFGAHRTTQYDSLESLARLVLKTKLSERNLVGVLCGVVIAAAGLPAAALAYTSPGSPTGHVNDFAQVLSSEAAANLNAELTAFNASTSNEIAVAIVPDMGGDYLENYAVKLFEEWGIGKAQSDNGVLLLLAIEEREIRIEVGYGLEGALPDSVAARIIDSMAPQLRAGDYDAAVAGAVRDIIAATQGEYVGESEQGSFLGGLPIEAIIFLPFFVLTWLAAILGRSKSWWAGGVLGFVLGVIAWVFGGSPAWAWALLTAALTGSGLLFDYIVSQSYAKAARTGGTPPWWGGGTGFGGGRSGGGFGGFGGGSSGGGGASGRW